MWTLALETKACCNILDSGRHDLFDFEIVPVLISSEFWSKIPPEEMAAKRIAIVASRDEHDRELNCEQSGPRH